MRIPPKYVPILLAATFFAACEEDTGQLSPVPGAAGPETSQLIRALRDVGATAEVIDIVPQGENLNLLNAPATRVQVNGAEVFVYEFASATEAESEARRVPQILTVTLFPSAPQFFRGNRLIVLYVGLDSAVITPLQRLLGPQFAGH